MFAYFKPLRRKIGVVKLVMACVLIGAWVRSIFIADGFIFEFMHSYNEIDSKRQMIKWQHLTVIETPPTDWPSSFEWTIRSTDYFSNLDSFAHTTVHTDIRFCGIHFATGDLSVAGKLLRNRAIIIPYWLLVTPLTLLSAYLLLSKPRSPQNPEK